LPDLEAILFKVNTGMMNVLGAIFAATLGLVITWFTYGTVVLVPEFAGLSAFSASLCSFRVAKSTCTGVLCRPAG
jgi:hypothetical protein